MGSDLAIIIRVKTTEGEGQNRGRATETERETGKGGDTDLPVPGKETNSSGELFAVGQWIHSISRNSCSASKRSGHSNS